jgi:hypothetical protein
VRAYLIASLFALTLSGCDGGVSLIFNPTNEIDKDAKCDGVRADLVKDRVDLVLKSDVIKAIEKQINDANKDKKELKPVKVRVFLVTLEEFKKELKDDGRTELDANDLFNEFDGYTYAPNTDKTGTIKIKIFCKPAIQEDIAQNDDKHGFDRKLVHELAHAKVIAMQDVGEEPPFSEGKVKGDPPPDGHKEDHNGKFSKEVDELMKKLPK